MILYLNVTKNPFIKKPIQRMKQIITILALVAVFSFSENGNAINNVTTSESVIETYSYPLRKVVLHPVDSDGNNCISAELIIEDGRYLLLYKEERYSFGRISDGIYDSAVIINGQEYLFRIRLRPYE